ncbi:MAG: ribonucleotide reductase subunit alpha [Bacteriovoracaceae bacterium]|mgnify:CR=1 FL=1|jgi:hypothetical protein|nr:ribonucleotide reductase subunit alpha [Bacteriovoracaceae bacterium]
MSQFNELLEKAKNMPQRQRLLFLFAKSTDMLDNSKNSHHSGTIDPVMCVDKRPEELTDFSALVDEADGLTKSWNFIFVSSLSGKEGNDPSNEEVDLYLQRMSNGLAYGEDLSKYLVWNRQEQVILIS